MIDLDSTHKETTMQKHIAKLTTVASFGLLAASLASAAVCPPSSDPCTVDLGHALVTFGQGPGSYFANAMQINGSDGYYSAVPDFLSTFSIVHDTGGDGFTFTPLVTAAVGGSGVNGFHEVMGYFNFTDLSFAAKPGYRLDGVQLSITGTQNFVGDAYVTLTLPVALSSNGSNFSATGQVDATNPFIQAEFVVSASYLEGPDGTALSYGTASAAFNTATFTAQVSAVPEPSHGAMLGLGAAVVLLRSRHRLV